MALGRGAVVTTARVLLGIEDVGFRSGWAEAEAQQSRSVSEMSGQLSKLEEAQLKVKIAEESRNRAIARGGADSLEAMRATLRLSQAENTLARETTKLNEQTALAGQRHGLYARSARDAEAETGKLTRGGLAASGMFTSLGRSVAFASAGFLGAYGFIGLLRSSLNEVGSLQIQLARSQRVFGESSRSLDAWAKTADTAFGLSRVQALKLSSDLGTMLVTLGQGPAKAAAMSQRLVELAADMAAFKGVPVEEAFTALQRGLAGQARGLKTFGIDLSTTRLQAEALSLGLIHANVDLQKVALAQDRISIAQAKLADARKHYAEGTTQVRSAEDSLSAAEERLQSLLAGKAPKLDLQTKALAAYQLILHDTRVEQGFFADHTQTLAEREAILKAQLANVKEEIGVALLPTVVNLLGHLSKWIEHLQRTGQLQRDLNAAVHIGTAIVQGITGAVRLFWPVLKTAAGEVGGLHNAILLLTGATILNKLGVLKLGLAAIGTESQVAAGSTGVGGLAGAFARLPKTVKIPIVVAIGATFAYPWLKHLMEKYLGADFSGTTPGGGVASPSAPGAIPAGHGLHWVQDSDGRWALFDAQGRRVRYEKIGGQYVAYPGQSAASREGLGSVTITGPSAAKAAAAERRTAQGAGLPSAATPTQRRELGSVLGYVKRYGVGSGITYVKGGVSPQTGYDCSGFLYAAYKAAGVTIPRTSEAQFADPNALDCTGQERAGDGVYFTGSGYTPPGHCGIMIDDQRFVEYFSQGQPAKIGFLGDHRPRSEGGDYWGARRWIKILGDVGSQPVPQTQTPGSRGPVTVGHKAKKAKAAHTHFPPPVPAGLLADLRVAQSTRGYADDVEVLKEIIDYLDERIAREKDATEKERLAAKLTQYRARLRIDEQRQLLYLISQVVPAEKRKIAQLEAGSFTVDPLTGQIGKPQVRFDPKTGRYSVVDVKPSLEGMKAELRHLLEKVLPALDKRIAAVRRAIARLHGGHGPLRSGSLAQLQETLHALLAERRELIGLASDLAVSIGDLSVQAGVGGSAQGQGFLAAMYEAKHSFGSTVLPGLGPAAGPAGEGSERGVSRFYPSGASPSLAPHSGRQPRHSVHDEGGRRATVIVNQTFVYKERPEDPHHHAKALQHELAHLVA